MGGAVHNPDVLGQMFTQIAWQGTFGHMKGRGILRRFMGQNPQDPAGGTDGDEF